MRVATRPLAVLAFTAGGWCAAAVPVRDPEIGEPVAANPAAVRGVFAVDAPKLPARPGDAEDRFQRIPPVAPHRRLAAAIAGGKTFRVTFDRLPEAEPLGLIRRDAVLTGFYTEATEAWEVWSPHHPQRPNHHFVYSPAGPPGRGFLGMPIRPGDGAICLWGAIFPFDEKGTVHHPHKPKVAVGRLELAP
jgi:hypothetical protein